MKVKCVLLASLCLLAANWQTQVSARDAGAAPADYRKLIAGGDLVATLRAKLDLVSPVEVSVLRPSVLTQPGDWMACVRESNSGLKSPEAAKPSDAMAVRRRSGPPRTAYYAVFFERGAILESRPAVIVDQCANMTYSPLPTTAKSGK